MSSLRNALNPSAETQFFPLFCVVARSLRTLWRRDADLESPHDLLEGDQIVRDFAGRRRANQNIARVIPHDEQRPHLKHAAQSARAEKLPEKSITGRIKHVAAGRKLPTLLIREFFGEIIGVQAARARLA